MNQSDVQNLAKNFLSSFYGKYEEDRTSLDQFFSNQSMASIEGTHAMGKANIKNAFINQIKANKIRHQVTTFDAHPLPDGAVFIMVTGKLRIDNDANAVNYSESFLLKKDPSIGNYYIHSNIFRINYG
ncbi:Nuclear transport factor 2 [Bonamia ostreae]|uniref:Nuclear transport factor 2 n=1 Tax=Bonamia ostreae TaxID=126728 RepID=A0ABV2AI12_9EUKA